jgi:murein DD-endopeptidase MepM/ murein hydrolase activator NlpD
MRIPSRARCATIAGLLAVGSLAAACIDIQEGTPKTSDSANGAVAAPAVASKGELIPVRGKFGPDSATHARGRPGTDSAAAVPTKVPAEVRQALRTDTTSTLDVVDSSPAATPTDADLAVLRRELIVPLSGVAPSALYNSYDEVRGGTRKHEALDIPAARGTPVLSAATGRVLKLFNSAAGGLMVYAADSTKRFILMYAHLDAYQPGLAEGQPLRRGQQIGTVGTSGNAAVDVPHLHFAIARSSDVTQWWKGAPVNPYPLLAR